MITSSIRGAQRRTPPIQRSTGRRVLTVLGATVIGMASVAILGPGNLAPTAYAHAPQTPTLSGNGLIRTRSAYSVAETADRLRADIQAKGIMVFADIDQAQLGAGAGVALKPSRLVLFGNPPLGVLFLTANPLSGLDWPVRMLIHEDKDGTVWTAYQDWSWVAARYGITNRDPEFAKATGVVAAIVEAIADCKPAANCTERLSR